MAETTLGNSTVNRTVTEYLLLVKPAGSDPVDVQDFNDNFDKIDDAWKALSDSIPEHIPSQAEIDEIKDDVNTLTTTVINHETRITNLENNPPASSLSDLTDVTLGTLQDGDVLKYSASQHKWINGEGQAGIGLVIDNGLLCCQYEG